MFKGHPKGLIAAALANMGERFGFYTMMAILVLFLQSKFGLDETNAGIIYSVFYALIYVLSLVGGTIADRRRNYKGTILIGLIVMTIGYVIMAIPTPTPVPNLTLYLTFSIVGLFVIAFGNGLFKGNLQALVGQMYNKGDYTDTKREQGFQIFYMFINVGAIFAPFIAPSIRSWWLNRNGFKYNANLPALCHQDIDGHLYNTKVIGHGMLDNAQLAAEKVFALDPASQYHELAHKATIKASSFNIDTFATHYLDAFTTGFHYAFGVAIFAMLISLTIYISKKKIFPNVPKKEEESTDIKMKVKEIKQRMYALLAVFGIVIFFWFSFHQNGLTLTFFARDYTNLHLGPWNLSVESFQAMNPFFVVFLIPLVILIFKWLKTKGIDPSTPKKIAIGMGIAASAYLLMSLASTTLPAFSVIDPKSGGSPLEDVQKMTPFLLIGTYLILTIAELFISPLGIAFVAKVAPPKYQGLMQGGWLGATALGNQLLFIGAIMYKSIPLWITWGVFVVVCLMSMFTMIFMVKWLEKIAK